MTLGVFHPSIKHPCTCGRIACICHIVRAHEPECRYRGAVACPVAFECQHGFDVCPVCDPCTCEPKSSANDPDSYGCGC